MTRWWSKRIKLGNQRGFTLIELMIVIAVIGILAAIAIPLYNNLTIRARVAKAQADVRSLASAVSMYWAHMGGLPAGLAALTVPAVNAQGLAAGPFFAAVPTPPPSGNPVWGPYQYFPDTAPGGAALNGVVVICSTGDGLVAHSEGLTATCP